MKKIRSEKARSMSGVMSINALCWYLLLNFHAIGQNPTVQLFVNNDLRVFHVFFRRGEFYHPLANDMLFVMYSISRT